MWRRHSHALFSRSAHASSSSFLCSSFSSSFCSFSPRASPRSMRRFVTPCLPTPRPRTAPRDFMNCFSTSSLPLTKPGQDRVATILQAAAAGRSYEHPERMTLATSTPPQPHDGRIRTSSTSDDLVASDWKTLSESISPKAFGRQVHQSSRHPPSSPTTGPFQHYQASQEILETSEKEDWTGETPTRVERTISNADVDLWLEHYDIPSEAFADCQNDRDVQAIRVLYARQLRLECVVHELSHARVASQQEKMVKELAKGSELTRSKSLVSEWQKVLTKSMTELRDRLRKNEPMGILHDNVAQDIDRIIYAPIVLLLLPEELSQRVISQVMNQVLTHKEGATYLKTTLSIGRVIQDTISTYKKNYEEALEYNATSKKPRAVPVNILMKAKEKIHYTTGTMTQEKFVKTVSKSYYSVDSWDKRHCMKLGGIFLAELVKCAMFYPGDDAPAIPAFSHALVHLEKYRQKGMVRAADEVYHHILKEKNPSDRLPFTARYLPMLVTPRAWTSVHQGGYLKLSLDAVRTRDSYWQKKCAARGSMHELYTALDTMASLPWVINTQVYDVMKAIWIAGGNVAGLPDRSDQAFPPPPPDRATEEEKQSHRSLCQKVTRKNRELHSLRCDALYKMQVADEFRNEEAIYFPYNMDFRGRVYPIPPNLNHLGDDVCRSLLIFKEAKPLGPAGFRWLKIHLANLFGVDKSSFAERETFIDAHLEQVLASAATPFEPDSWWLEAEYPFLALGACFEIQAALAFENGTNVEGYPCRLPIHQDGTCNGLQHYAALGLDATGGYQVNLRPSDRPQDVYAEVADRVMATMQLDSHATVPEKVEDPGEAPIKPKTKQHKKEYETTLSLYNDKLKVYKNYLTIKNHKEYSQLVQNHISRKVVKQTVMTSVYGVTYIGARKQIHARLLDSMLVDAGSFGSEWEHEIYNASCYAAGVTLESMTNLFSEARSIMKWLSDLATIVSSSNSQPMSWITPQGLPVVQPYRKSSQLQIRTKMQHVLVACDDQTGVSVGKQKSAFPPNFVHSLDSAHMFYTAQECKRLGLAFAAVHDSFWTHAATVDTMNVALREQFIVLYSKPILEDLLTQLKMRYPDESFPDIPERGDLVLSDVLESDYFFN